MKSEKSQFRKNRALLNLVFIALFTTIYFFTLPIKSNTDDDYMFSLLINGYNGSSIIPFINRGGVSLLIILKRLFQVTYIDIMDILVIACSCTIIVIINNSFKNRLAIACNAIYVFLWCEKIFELRSRMDYAVIFGLAGSLLLLKIDASKINKKSVVLLLISEVQMISSLMFSGIVFLIYFSSLILIFSFRFIRLFVTGSDKKKINKSYVYKGIVVLIPLIMCGVNVLEYDSNNEFKQSIEYQKTYETLYSKEIPSWESYQYTYKRIGLTQNDVMMITNRTINNNSIFSKKVLDQVIDIQNNANWGNNYSEKVLYDQFFKIPYMVAVILIFIVSLWVCSNNRIMILVSGALSVVIQIFIYNRTGAEYLNKFIFPFLGGILLTSLYALLIEDKLEISVSRIKIYFVSMVIAIFSINSFFVEKQGLPSADNIELIELFSDISKDKENIYYIQGFDTVDKISLYNISCSDNVVFDGGNKWGSVIESQTIKDSNKRFWFVEDNVYMVSKSSLYSFLMYNYVLDHYNGDVQMLHVKSYGDYIVYKIEQTKGEE